MAGYGQYPPFQQGENSAHDGSQQYSDPKQYNGQQISTQAMNAGDALADQMGGLGLTGAAIAPRGGKKKKDRHAYHALEPSPAAGFSAAPSLGTPITPFMGGDAQFQHAQSGQFGEQPQGQEITPQMHQFPAPAGTVFSPANPLGTAPFPSSQPAQDTFIAETSVQTSAQGRVDPDQIPSIPRARDAVASYYLNNIYPTFEHHNPPPAALSYVAYDQGNSSPKFARLTMNNIPSAVEGLKSTGLPLGLLLQPLAPLQPGELEIPVLDFGDIGPPRCHRCRAYINPFMVFRNGGNKFVCNMCTYPNDVPPEYFCATNPQGARVDREQRPELMRGTVEFMVPKEYWSKEPVGLRILFMIDVCQESITKGFLQAFCEGVLAALYGPPQDVQSVNGAEHVNRSIPIGAKVGFVTFDKDIHFYNCNVSACEAAAVPADTFAACTGTCTNDGHA